MSQENTETSTEFELLPPQTVEPDGTLVDETRKVNADYGGILAAEAKGEAGNVGQTNNDFWEKQARRQSALNAATSLGLTDANGLVTAAKALESYLAGE